MAGEQLILDPTSEDATNTQLDITSSTAGYWLISHDYPTPDDDEVWASSADTEGARRANTRPNNRTITCTVRCREAAGTPVIGTIVGKLQQKIGKLNREGGTYKRVLPSGDVIVFDVLAARVNKVPSDQAWAILKKGDVDLQFTCRPYGRGAELDLGDNVETTLPVLVFTDTGVKGDVPGLGRLLIDEDQGVGQRTLIWGVQSQRYDSLDGLFFEAESGGGGNVAITAVHAAIAAAALAGASGAGSNTMRDLSLVTSWTDPNSRQFKTASRHIGTFRLYARVSVPNTNTGTVSMRATWRNSNDPFTDNDVVTINPTYQNTWVLVDLGLISFRVPYHGGTADNEIDVRAISSVAGDDLYTDWIMLLPVDEGCGIATTTDTTSVVVGGGEYFQVSNLGAFSSSVVSPITDAVWTRPQKYEGDYFLVPPAGVEGRTVRVIVKASRGRPLTAAGGTVSTSFADAGIDDISARLYYTPRYLVVPEP